MTKPFLIPALLLAALMATPLPALAKSQRPGAVTEAKLSPADAATLKDVEAYLNGMRRLSADVLQANPDGSVVTGTLKLERPGHMRLTYTPPSESFVVADGSFLHYWDDDLRQTTSVPLGDSLAALILQDQVKLSGDIEITGFQHAGGVIEVSLVKRAEPEAGQLTLVFNDAPIRLRQWRVLDPQGAVTRVSLNNVNNDPSFPSGTFAYRAPNFGQNPKARQNQLPGAR